MRSTSAIVPFTLTLAGLLLLPSSGNAAGVVTTQVTTGNTSGLPYIVIGSDSSSYISYVAAEGSNLWGAGLGLAIYNKTGSQTQHCAPLVTFSSDTLSGQALPMRTSSSGVVLFHHRWQQVFPAGNRERFQLLRVNTSCGILNDAPVTGPPTCTNADNWQAGARLADGTYAMVYSSCEGTGTDQTDRNNLFYSRWSQDGTPVGSLHTLVNSTFVREGRLAMVAGASAIHVFYVDYRTGKDVLYGQRIDFAGNTLTAEKVVARGASIGGLRIDAAADGAGVLHLFWSENRTGLFQLFETRVSQTCDSLAAAFKVTSSGATETNPRVRIDREDVIHLIWNDSRSGTTGVYYRATFESPARTLVSDLQISTAGVNTKMADMDVDGRLRARVAWTTGTTSIHGNVFYTVIDLVPLGVDSGAPSLVTGLHVLPNPFADLARIAYRLTAQAKIELAVYDLGGRRVASLRNGLEPAGEHSVFWNGEDARGVELPAGLYFVRLQTAGARHEARIARLR